ncbi:MAG TPA: glycosyltransferase [Bryobacteraceae bacterium]|jgi:spore maturation protein CgeB|nr:glycosyltransferase [Bryobacteraceae bacterium]
MNPRMEIAFFGSSLLSAYWNGAATYYRGIIKSLHKLGHHVTFYEPDAFDRQSHRDLEPPAWAESIVYSAEGTDAVYRALEKARRADLIVKASGVGVFDELLEREIPAIRKPDSLAVFWDVDAPATLDRLDSDATDAFRELVPKYDWIFTYGGGDPVVNAYKRHGARECIPIYNALDPETHYAVTPDPRFEGELGFLGNRLPDREARVEEFFLKAATLCPQERFLLGGNGWHDRAMPANVRYYGHVYTADHNAFNCTPKAVLNISRESMARYGFSPATRVFEAAGSAACLITDEWIGIEQFFEPGKEILVASSGEQVADILRWLTPEQARQIGGAAYRRVLAEHTYEHRAKQVDHVLLGRLAAIGR